MLRLFVAWTGERLQVQGLHRDTFLFALHPNDLLCFFCLFDAFDRYQGPTGSISFAVSRVGVRIRVMSCLALSSRHSGFIARGLLPFCIILFKQGF